jgi:dienelactone hydrolase
VGFSDRFRLELDEPLGALFQERPAPAAFRPARQLRFEYTSRGDRVSGRLLLPPGSGRHPLALVGHGAGGAKDAGYMDAAVAPWVHGGAAVASIDFPLHGERASAKLSERLLASLAPGAGSGHEALWLEFAGQAAVDLERALDALALHPEIDTGRAVYAGFSLGTILGALFCAGEPRVRAAALAIGGGRVGPPGADPTEHIADFAPRPLLFVNATRDERISRERAEALHAAAAEPKQVLWFECGHADLPGRALKAMWQFLKPHLEL